MMDFRMGEAPGPLETAAGAALSGRLRAETRPEHEAIEATLDLPHSMGTIRDYTWLLEGFHGFYQPLEQALRGLDWTDSGIDLHERLKTPLIRADLEACDIAPDSVPRCRNLPPCGNLAEGFGCLYVLEGSTMGGAIIHRALGARFGDWLNGKDHYYQCYGENRGLMWRQFRQALDRFGAASPSADQDSTVHAARATFRNLQGWLGG